jgi:hypothetical protein
MTKDEFIEFIKDIGFSQTWGYDSNTFSMSTDVVGLPNQSGIHGYADQLKITINDELGIAQLSLSQMSAHMMAGKNFGNFSLKPFGDPNDFQLEIFLSFILSSFNEKPKQITQWMRDKKIENILK